MMAKKDGMYFYNDWLVPFEKLERAEVGDLVIAMMRYFVNGEKPPRFQGLAGMAADFIFPQIDRSMEYARLGSRGGIATTKKSRSPKSEGSCPKKKVEEIEITEELPKEEEVYFESDLELEIPAPPQPVKVEEKPRETCADVEQRMFDQMVREDRFNKFWRNYPKKSGKQEAKTAFDKFAPDDSLLKEMLGALARQKATQMWKKEDGRFIPYPARWIEGRRWEDEAKAEVDSGIEAAFDTDDFFMAALKRGYEY